MRIVCAVFALAISSAAAAASAPTWVAVEGGDWKPSPTLFPEVEVALKAALPNAAAHRGRIPDWGSYTFQYQGVTTLVGKRYLLVNAFCDDPGHHPDVRTKWVKVMDGGACFFSAKYDPAAHALYDVLVNGVA